MTLHELWRIGWGGRTINLTASAMVPARSVPVDAALVFVSIGEDNLPTRDPTFVQDECKKYPGIIHHFHAPDEPHMPNTGQLIRGISEIVMKTMTHPNPNPSLNHAGGHNNKLCHWQSALNSIDEESNIRNQLIFEPHCLGAREWQKIDKLLSQGTEDTKYEHGKQKLRNILKQRQCLVPLDPDMNIFLPHVHLHI